MSDQFYAFVHGTLLPSFEQLHQAICEVQPKIALRFVDDLRTHDGYWPAVWGKDDTGFEWSIGPAQDVPGIEHLAIGERSHAVGFGFFDQRELACAAYVAGALAKLADGIVQPLEGDELLSAEKTFRWAREIQKEIPRAPRRRDLLKVFDKVVGPLLNAAGFSKGKPGGCDYVRITAERIKQGISVELDTRSEPRFSIFCGLNVVAANEDPLGFLYAKHFTGGSMSESRRYWMARTPEETMASVNQVGPLIVKSLIPWFDSFSTLAAVVEVVPDGFMLQKARMYVAIGQHAKALPHYEQCIEWIRQHPDDPDSAAALPGIIAEYDAAKRA